MIANFMGGDAVPGKKPAASSPGAKSNTSSLEGEAHIKRSVIQNFLTGVTGGGNAGKGTKPQKAMETSLAASAGKGATSGLPTCSDNGLITMTFRQINQDGAGPLKADVDGTSGGTNPDAFKTAEVMQNVPSLPIGGLSLATNTDFPITVQMPAGMNCDASVGAAHNVCIVRIRNGALAGPFDGSAAFTQSPAGKKRALEYRLKRRAEEAEHRNRRLRRAWGSGANVRDFSIKAHGMPSTAGVS